MKVLVKRIFFLLVFFNNIPNSYAERVISFSDTSNLKPIGAMVYTLEDKTGRMSILDVATSNLFIQSQQENPYFGISSSSYWIKFELQNKTEKNVLLQIGNPLLDEVELYKPISNGKYKVERTGEKLPFAQRPYQAETFIFKLNNSKEIQTYYLKIKGGELLIVPLSIGTEQMFQDISETKNIIVGIFAGLMLAMIFYNSFIYFSIRDQTYLFYILGTLFVFLTQLSFLGYSYKFLWPEQPWFNNLSPVLFTSLAALFVFNFARLLLNTKEIAPAFTWFIYTAIAAYGFATIFKALDIYPLSYHILDICALSFSVYVIILTIKRIKQNYRPARFFLFAWSILLIGFSLFALKDLGLLPYNEFTNYTMPAGTALESIIFSLALADRINILKKENEEKQNEIIRHLQEKEKHLRAAKESELILEKLKKETLISQIDSLKNQLHPHFLFNSLNILTELIQQNQNKAVKFVEELSDVYRYVLDSRNKEVIEIESELKFIEAFIYLLKIRFSDKINVHINLTDIEHMVIPPLALQLLIENAIKHNIVSSQQPLSITINHESDYLIIKNNLQQKAVLMKSSGKGLLNIKSRYSFLTDKKVMISQEEGCFIVKLPILKLSAQ